MKPAKFQEIVWQFYDEHGRNELPWRQTHDPYKIYISEIMLQQTQAGRVIEKYESWLEDLPTFQAVAEAKKKEILARWQGLGYNRRALYIKEACETITQKYDGKLPDTEAELRALPGIGPYTAGALLAFVFNQPAIFVETNIRTVFIHHFFADKTEVSDAEIKEQVAATLPEENIREWYWALMDYGSYLKKEVGNLNAQTKSYQKQSKFTGSNRQLRAELTRFVLENEPTTLTDLEVEFRDLVAEHERMQSVSENVKTLEKEGFLVCMDNQIKTSK